MRDNIVPQKEDICALNISTFYEAPETL